MTTVILIMITIIIIFSSNKSFSYRINRKWIPTNTRVRLNSMSMSDVYMYMAIRWECTSKTRKIVYYILHTQYLHNTQYNKDECITHFHILLYIPVSPMCKHTDLNELAIGVDTELLRACIQKQYLQKNAYFRSKRFYI